MVPPPPPRRCPGPSLACLPSASLCPLPALLLTPRLHAGMLHAERRADPYYCYAQTFASGYTRLKRRRSRRTPPTTQPPARHRLPASGSTSCRPGSSQPSTSLAACVHGWMPQQQRRAMATQCPISTM